MSPETQSLIVGAGVSGLSMARWCLRMGASALTVVDTREAAVAQAQAQLPQVPCVVSPLNTALMQRLQPQAVWVSPGLSPAALQELTQWCAQHRVPMGNELDLFSAGLVAHCNDTRPMPAVLAITGTNGKTTVTALSTHLLQHAGVDAIAAGNIGPAMLDALGQCLDTARWPAAWVLELSSFQLFGCSGVEPNAATVLNVTPDHLDWHGDMDAYAAAKARVFGADTHRILNRADPWVMAWQPPEPVAKRRRKTDEALPPTWSSFGLDQPQRVGDWGVEMVNGMAWLVRAQGMDSGSTDPRDGEPAYLQRLMPAEALRIRGRHNWANALAALALASRVSADVAGLLHGLREYTGEAHRVQTVTIVADVEYVDDSKGTNVGATLAALLGLGADRRLVVILGGDGKGQDFSPLREPLQACARGVVLIGRDGPAIAEVLQDVAFPLAQAKDLPQAVAQATAMAQAGDVVLLSPACASLDMFDNYAHRARVFVDAVQALAQAQGATL